jgi:peroxiredoxin Q/BCP
MAKLEIGDAAPAFTLTDTDGQPVSLQQFAGSRVVLYFYPKDDTPGCTKQACALRDAWRDFAGRAAVFGVSIDSAKSHAKFIAKHALPFPLLTDEDKQLVAAYGVWVEKSMYGKTYMGTERTTFVIGPDGKIKAIFRKVKPDEHAALVRSAL